MSGPAQSPEAGIIILGKTERLLSVDSYRPLDSAAYLLASDYQIEISAEDPPFACSDDVIDTHPSRKFPLAAEHAYLPKGGSFDVRFFVNTAKYPLDPADLLNRVVLAYNRKNSFQYQLRRDGDFMSFVPVSGRNTACNVMTLRPLLDQIVSLPSEQMGIYSAVAALEARLSEKAREPVSISSQDWQNHMPDLPVRFRSRSAPARELLLTIIKATHYRFYWLAREQPLRSGWSISLIH